MAVICQALETQSWPFPTSSHPDRIAIGVLRASLMAGRAGLPVYALGGVNAQTVTRLKDARLAGIAAIEGLLPD